MDARALDSLEQLFASADQLRGPFTITGNVPTFVKLHESAELALTELHDVSNPFVQKARAVQAQQRLASACASHLADSLGQIEPDAAVDALRSAVPSHVRSLSGLHGEMVGAMVDLLLGCVQQSEDKQRVQGERLARAEKETSDLLDAAEQLERQVQAQSHRTT
jgi:hypothetical protein